MISAAPRRGAPVVVSATMDELVERARSMISPGRRRILGVTGAPGAGKSTVSAAIAAALGPDSALVGMDGFHLSNEELLRLGRLARKGAPDTFDAGGYAALLARVKHEVDETVYVPFFNRTMEQSIGSAVAVEAGVPLVITEGNYLLLDDPQWLRARSSIDELWFLDVDDDTRRRRLVLRHEAFGKTAAEAEHWVSAVDQRNAAVIRQYRERADLVVQLREATNAPNGSEETRHG